MLYQYHCACCDKIVASTEKVCPYCGSQHIKSPYGLWGLCIVACLVIVVFVKLTHVHNQYQQNTKSLNNHSVLEIFKQNSQIQHK